VDELLAGACQETGLDDFGPEEFREALRQLVDSTNRDIVLSPIGEMAFKGEVHKALVNRLRFAADLKRHPEIAEEDISDPIIILGLPRTGSTKLQRMMAADPDALGVKFWQIMNPAPFPGAAAGAEDPRIEAGRQALIGLAQISPGFMQSHPTQVGDADEEAFLQTFTFKSLMNYFLHPAHGYFDWLTQQSLRGSFNYMKSLLQYLQWQQGGKQGRPWMLKSPVNMNHLGLMLELFPKARFVFTHRPPRQIIPSFCRLTEMSWRIKTDDVDLHQIGRFATKLWAREIDEHLAQRDALGSRIEIMDVQYDAIREDPLAVIGAIYERAGRDLTPRRAQAMRDWAAADVYGHFGQYSYTLEDYGLSRDVVDAAFGGYIERFGG
jgi:hypothetical protein